MGVQDAITRAQALLQSLEDKTLDIITRASPTTWGQLRDFFEVELVPILIRLFEEVGGLAEIPHIDLPDGVVSTSLVSQSEMTQFVTNTLNVWQAKLLAQFSAGDNWNLLKLRPIFTIRPNKAKTYTLNLEVPTIATRRPIFTVVKKIDNTYSVGTMQVRTVNITRPSISIRKGV